MCELGAGLGLVSILLDKLAVCSELVVTDGDEDTLQLLVENKIDNEASFDTSYLLWGEHEDFLSEHPDLFDTLIAADVIYEEEQIVPLLQTVKALLKSKKRPPPSLSLSYKTRRRRRIHPRLCPKKRSDR